MQLRAYYWKARISPFVLSLLRRLRYPKSSYFFRKGNFGDLFYEDIARHRYGHDIEIKIIKNESRRLLIIGSIVQTIQPLDMICGAGSKYPEIPAASNDCRVVGLRGPLTYAAMEQAGYDLSNVKSLYDPGLLVRFIYPDSAEEQSKAHGAIFIPHYRERYHSLSLPNGVRLCDPDNAPETVANTIKQSEIVYSSSLHGIIFAHAYGRPAVFVRPTTYEPTFKYDDYYASIGLPPPVPLNSINDIDIKKDIGNSPDLQYREDDIHIPDAQELLDLGLMHQRQ